MLVDAWSSTLFHGLFKLDQINSEAYLLFDPFHDFGGGLLSFTCLLIASAMK